MKRLYPISTIPVNRIQESNPVPESTLVSIWEKIQPGTVLKDRFGVLVTIFSPGRKNKSEGPDFLDAVIWVRGKMKKGAVEIHCHESSWRHHRHGDDPRYDPVILHVVSTFARRPVLMVPTVHLKVQSNIKKQLCLLPNQTLSPDQLTVLMDLGLKRWEEKVLYFNKDVANRKKRIFIESLANFGTGENRPLFRELGLTLFPVLKKNISKESWVKTFSEFSAHYPWHRGGTRPARHPQRILDGIACWSYEMFVNPVVDPTLPHLKQHFKANGFGEWTWVEWCGNVHYPAMAVGQTAYAANLEKWSGLRLPVPYGGLYRFFGTKLTRKQLRSFPIAQGLLYLKHHYCAGRHCHLCTVRRSL